MSTNVGTEQKGRGLRIVRQQIDAATGAPKCRSCGCFHSMVAALEETEVGCNELSETLVRARTAFLAKQYDCLGCPVCYPAVAANALAEEYPEQSEQPDLCPADIPHRRGGWPPLPGDYHVIRYRAPVAVCTLNSAELARQLAGAAPDGLAIAGTLHTENLGIERLICNVLGNPHIRFLLLCGDDTLRAIGHLPGQSLVSLFENGLDERGRIRGAQGKRPVLRNISREQVEAFVEQIELADMIGVTEEDRVARKVEAFATRDPGPCQRHVEQSLITPVSAAEPRLLMPDPAGYFVVYPDARRSLLILEHYSNDGVLDVIVGGRSPAAVYAAAIEQTLLSDHIPHTCARFVEAEVAAASQIEQHRLAFEGLRGHVRGDRNSVGGMYWQITP